MPANGTVLRAYRREDLDGVIEVFQRAVREVASRDYDPDQIAAWSKVDRAEWDEYRLRCPTWVAVRDARIVGFSDLEPDGHLDMMFVHPDCQRTGIATMLLERVERAARDRSLGIVFTEASLTARPFFLARGFEIVTRQNVVAGGETFLNFRMRKRIV